MDILKSIEGDNTIRPIPMDKYKEGEIISRCEKCGEPIGICKTLLDRKYACKIACKCSLQELKDLRKLEELQERRFTINKYFGDISDNASYKDCTFENWDFNKVKKEYYNTFRMYAIEFQKNLDKNIGIMIEGTPGNGKTYSSACVINEIEKRGYIGLIIQLPKLIEKAELYKSDGLTSSAIYKKLRYADLVVLDDFGIEKKFDKEKIYTIINEIYLAKKPLIITTNLTIEEIKEYHSRIRSRLNSICPIVLTIQENNLRMAEGTEKKNLFKSLFGRR